MIQEVPFQLEDMIILISPELNDGLEQKFIIKRIAGQKATAWNIIPSRIPNTIELTIAKNALSVSDS